MTNSNLLDCATGSSGWLCALEDLPAAHADLTIHVCEIGPVAISPPGFDELASGIGRGNPIVDG
jgi:hypothetical protein